MTGGPQPGVTLHGNSNHVVVAGGACPSGRRASRFPERVARLATALAVAAALAASLPCPAPAGASTHPNRAPLRAEIRKATALIEATRFEEAQPLADSVLAVARAGRDTVLLAEALLMASTLASRSGRLGEALALADEGYALGVAAGAPAALPALAYRRGLLHVMAGRNERAAAILDSGATIARGIRDRSGEGLDLSLLAEVRKRQGRADEARDLSRHAYRLLRVDRNASSSQAGVSFAWLLADADSMDAALQVMTDVASYTHRIGVASEVNALLAFADLLLTAKRPRDGLPFALRAVERLRGEERNRGYVMAHAALAKCWLALGELGRAATTLSDAERVWEEWRGWISEPGWRETLGETARPLAAAEMRLALLDPALDPVQRADRLLRIAQVHGARTLIDRMSRPDDARRDALAGSALEPVPLAEFRRSVLRAGEALVVVQSYDDTVVVLAVDRTRSEIYGLPGSNEAFEAHARELARDLARPPAAGADSAGVLSAGSALGDLLLGPSAPIWRNASVIHWCVEGALAGIPAAWLAQLEAAETRPTPVIAQWPSPSVLIAMRRRDAGTAATAGRGLAIAGPREGGSSPLPGARDEASFLAHEFRGIRLRYPASRADREALVRDLAGAPLAHFAAHIRVNDEDPLDCAIRLGADSSAVLTAADVLGLELSRPLVVLSGCESAGGAAVPGEGVLGLTSAFLASGADAVVASLWKVDDRATATFMRHFYGTLARGAGSAEALASARTRMRREVRTAEPFYWASFVLVGLPEARVTLARRPFLERNAFALAAGLAAVALAAWILARRRRPAH